MMSSQDKLTESGLDNFGVGCYNMHASKEARGCGRLAQPVNNKSSPGTQ